MKNFRSINLLLGWGLFIGATVIYTLTVEPTASFWDCGEYIAAAYRLQVTHPPGAPFFLLLARMFSFLAGHDVTKVAFWINMSSVLASAGSVMVIFWIISLMGRKVLGKPADKLQANEAAAVWGAGIVGALTLTFCSTFWSIATETETYAFSMLVMCLAVWAMLNWEHIQNIHQAHRWLILVAYLLGLSIGMRIFSLLTIPGLSLIFYFHKTKQASIKGVILTLFISGSIILGIYAVIMPGLPSAALQLELWCVNQLGLPFKSGIVLFGLLSMGSLVYGLVYSIKKGKVRLNISLLCLTFILLGYASYGLVLIRAKANPPINENDPSDVISFISYLKREQYGHRALLYGPQFSAQIISQENGDPVYRKTATKYELIAYKPTPIFEPRGHMLFPRIWSQAPTHVAAYRALLNLKPWEQPKFSHNLKFLLKHQLGYFYFRYFLWNFAGRASDIQGALWLTPLDALKTLPYSIAQNPGRSNFLLLPLLLGLLGMFFQYNRDKHSFWVVLSLFLMLGVALVLFLNPPPIEPRERDYIYVGSFLIFTIWIGLGALATIEYLDRKLTKPMLATLLGTIVCLLAPMLMAAQNWRSHDRSGRYFSVDSAKNLLASCAPNAILFTGGDNDTFPLWYVQEVEGFRTDVRVIVLTYANTAWYLRQMLRPVHQSAPLPLSIDPEEYRQYGLNDFLPHIPQSGIQGPLDLQQYLQLIRQNHPALQVRTITGEYTNSLPVKTMSLPTNRKDILAKGLVAPMHQHLVGDTITWELKGRGLEKKDLILLDLIATNNWERPIYFNHTSLKSLNLDLKKQVVIEGTAIRLLPIQNNTEDELVNTTVMYDNLLHGFYWRNLDNPQVYYDENYRGFITNHRLAFHTLAKALIQTGEIEKAKDTLLYCLKIIPDKAIPYDGANAYMVSLFFEVGETEKALEIIRIMGERAEEILAYKVKERLPIDHEMQKQIAIIHEITRTLFQAGQEELAQMYQDIFHQYYSIIEQ
jgi:tetratricopeptide (TPR) repeat protein